VPNFTLSTQAHCSVCRAIGAVVILISFVGLLVSQAYELTTAVYSVKKLSGLIMKLNLVFAAAVDSCLFLSSRLALVYVGRHLHHSKEAAFTRCERGDPSLVAPFYKESRSLFGFYLSYLHSYFC